ncbi:hypothetical protein GGR32_000431 [Mesonia hippocampi]|uniref:Uncharacterized protein n=1 Tax=Mesonia hippocampi TaxID=1628250 RepID=A0A840EID3_9FLAO|nr:hypothetical protein [Mesonia hippocampi]MBB4118159.1 hypothetical protein [Mesonia hippocampi]
MMKEIRANKICRFLKADLEVFKSLVIDAKIDIDIKEIRPTTKFTEPETEKIFIAFGKTLHKFFKNSNLNKNQEIIGERIEYPIKLRNIELIDEQRLLNSIFYCIKTQNKDFLINSINDFQQKSKFRKHIEFLNLKNQVQSTSSQNNYIELFNKLVNIIENTDDQITDNKNKDIEQVKEKSVEKNEVNNTDYEKIVMESFRTGNQDKFGY